MRNLTIKREKTFVGCLGKMKVYIEDASGDTKICNTDSKLLGTLKNGEEATFEIEEGGAEIFVIADNLSKEYCYDRYRIEPGAEDVTIKGKNRFNPFLGNPFRFDGHENTSNAEEQKLSLKKGLVAFICAIVIGLVFGYGATTAIFDLILMQEESFTSGEISITLTRAFHEQPMSGYEAVFVSQDVEIMVFKNSFSKINNPDMTDSEYARAVLNNMKITDSKESHDNGLTSFVFTKTAGDGNDYVYHLYAFKTDEAYWHIFFAVKENKAYKYSNLIPEWADSVEFE